MTIIEERGPTLATQSLVRRPSELFFTGRPNAIIGRRYRLGTLLGKGGVGRVRLALDERLDRAVALKEVPHDRAHFGGSAFSEARAAARICDPGVMKVYDFVTTADRETDWIVMEALSGENLASAVKRSGPIETDEARFVGRHLLTALTAVHRSGLVHGDLKPGNVQLANDGRVAQLDLGLTAAPRIERGSTHGLIMGTPAFLAPEVLDQGHYSPASDQYALGMTLYRATDGGGDLSPLIAGLLHPNPQKRWEVVKSEDFLIRSVIRPNPRRFSPLTSRLPSRFFARSFDVQDPLGRRPRPAGRTHRPERARGSGNGAPNRPDREVRRRLAAE